MAGGRMGSTLISLTFSCFLLVPVFAHGASMKLLTPKVGWVLHYPGLMWTTDGGSHWKNITPPVPSGEHIASVFFRNAQQGWVLLAGPEEKGSDVPRFDLAVTNDTGVKWSVTHVTVPGLNPGFPILAEFGQVDCVDFVDAHHGWLNLGMVSSPNFASALMIETDNGGKTWSRPPRAPGVTGELRFINSTDGWLAGGPGGGHLYVTHDGSNSWSEVSLSPLPQVGRSANATFPSVPVFEGRETGFLPVAYSGTGASSFLALFATDDDGRTWNPETVQTRPGSMRSAPATVAAATLISGSVTGRTLTLVRASSAGTVVGRGRIVPPRAAVVELSFATATEGWALVGYHGTMTDLLSTSDGGNTWTDITPRPPQKPIPPAKPPKWRSIDPLTGRPIAESNP
jgi:photosystem II stability/assembly factor-like uncharacterized protein